jgi:hypothetical protein
MDQVQVPISPPTVVAVEEFGRVLESLDREVPPEPA